MNEVFRNRTVHTAGCAWKVEYINSGWAMKGTNVQFLAVVEIVE